MGFMSQIKKYIYFWIQTNRKYIYCQIILPKSWMNQKKTYFQPWLTFDWRPKDVKTHSSFISFKSKWSRWNDRLIRTLARCLLTLLVHFNLFWHVLEPPANCWLAVGLGFSWEGFWVVGQSESLWFHQNQTFKTMDWTAWGQWVSESVIPLVSDLFFSMWLSGSPPRRPAWWTCAGTHWTNRTAHWKSRAVSDGVTDGVMPDT